MTHQYESLLKKGGFGGGDSRRPVKVWEQGGGCFKIPDSEGKRKVTNMAKRGRDPDAGRDRGNPANATFRVKLENGHRNPGSHLRQDCACITYGFSPETR